MNFDVTSHQMLSEQAQSHYFLPVKQKCKCCYLQILTLGCIISSDASRPASGLDVMLILESVTPPFIITRPFAIDLPVALKKRERERRTLFAYHSIIQIINLCCNGITYLRLAFLGSACISLFYIDTSQ